jgi:hypothetical protein
MRSLLVALLAVTIAAPSAHAAVRSADFLPVYGPGDGVRLTQGNVPQLRFGPKAAKLYRTLAGRRVSVVCGAFDEKLSRDYTVRGRTAPLPRRRSNVSLNTGGRPDVCALATGAKLNDSPCWALVADTEDQCAAVIVAVTPRGRTYLDRLHRVIELVASDDQITSLPPDWAPTPVELLQGAIEADVVGLPTPDAAPPRGKLGLFGDGANHTVAVVLQDGTRLFLRREGQVITTNVPELFGRPLTVF